MLGIFLSFCCRLLTFFFKKNTIFQKIFTQSVSNGLDPDQDRRSVDPDLCPTCLQRLYADDKFLSPRARKVLKGACSSFRRVGQAKGQLRRACALEQTLIVFAARIHESGQSEDQNLTPKSNTNITEQLWVYV